jgi:hypothetical protein
MQLLTAIVNGSPRAVSTKYGDRSVMDVRLPNNEVVTIWGAANSKDILCRANGERVQIALDSKGKYHVVETAQTPVMTATMTTDKPVTPKPEYNAHNGRSSEIADYVERLGKLFNHCYKTAEGIAEKSDQRAIATTLFIQTVKHFDL